MATLANDPRGFRRVFVDSPTRKRYTIRLGKVSAQHAQGFRSKCRALEDAVKLGLTPCPDIMRWLNALADKMHAKLVKAGLVAARTVSTVGPWLDEYIEARSKVIKVRSATRLRETARDLQAFFGVGRSVRLITKDQASQWQETRMLAGLSQATIRTECGNAKQFFNDAVARGLIESNPFAHLKSGSLASAVDAYASADDCHKIIAALPDAKYRLLFGLARWAGLRIPSESRVVTSADVNLADGLMSIRISKTEAHVGKHFRQVPICDHLRGLLQERMGQCQPGERLIAMASDKSLDGHSRRIIAEAMRMAQVERWPKIMQTLRSSCAKDWKAEGVPEFAVDAWLGHNNVTSRKHYTSNVPPQMFTLVTGIVPAARKAARTLADYSGRNEKTRDPQNGNNADLPELSDRFHRVPLGSLPAKIGATGFEPAASWSRTKRSTKLSYAPNLGHQDHLWRKCEHSSGGRTIKDGWFGVSDREMFPILPFWPTP